MINNGKAIVILAESLVNTVCFVAEAQLAGLHWSKKNNALICFAVTNLSVRFVWE